MTTPNERAKAVVSLHQSALDAVEALRRSRGLRKVLIDRDVLERMAAALKHYPSAGDLLLASRLAPEVFAVAAHTGERSSVQG